MTKVTKITPSATKEEKLAQLSKNLEILKDELAGVLDKYEKDGEEEYTDTLTEALDAMNDAYDAVEDVLMDLDIE